MDDVERELRAQFRDALGGVNFPVGSQFELLPALPDGVRTRFEAGDVSVTVADLATSLGAYQDFPYDTVEELTDDVIAGMKGEDML